MYGTQHAYNSTWHMVLTSPPPVYDEIMPVSKGPTAAPNGCMGRECMGEEKRQGDRVKGKEAR